MAHKKAASSTDNGRDSASKRLGVKLFGGQVAKAGNIIVRQRGTKYHPGLNTYIGKDFTLHARVAGIVSFQKKKYNRTFVNITPLEVIEETVGKIVAEPVVMAKPIAVAEAVEETVETTVEAVEETVETTVEAVEETVETTAEAVEETVETTVEAVEETVETTVEAIEETVETTVEAIEETVETTVEAVEETVETTVEAVEETVETTAEAVEETVETTVEAVEETVEIAAMPKGIKQDDLKIIEGVGPKIASLLQKGGLDTWAKVAAATPEQIKEILETAGPRYNIHNPGTWPKQAEMANQGKFDELKIWQDELDGGK